MNNPFCISYCYLEGYDYSKFDKFFRIFGGSSLRTIVVIWLKLVLGPAWFVLSLLEDILLEHHIELPVILVDVLEGMEYAIAIPLKAENL